MRSTNADYPWHWFDAAFTTRSNFRNVTNAIPMHLAKPFLTERRRLKVHADHYEAAIFVANLAGRIAFPWQPTFTLCCVFLLA
jgi:hypothetical protein